MLPLPDIIPTESFNPQELKEYKLLILLASAHLRGDVKTGKCLRDFAVIDLEESNLIKTVKGYTNLVHLEVSVEDKVVKLYSRKQWFESEERRKRVVAISEKENAIKFDKEGKRQFAIKSIEAKNPSLKHEQVVYLVDQAIAGNEAMAKIRIAFNL